MSGGRPKPAIPAWQRATQPRPATNDDPVYSQPEGTGIAHAEQASESHEDAVTGDGEAEDVPSDDTSPRTTPIAASTGTESAAFDTNDFKSFAEQHHPARQEVPTPQFQQRPAAPPIITYPEFLMEAHKPPPLTTPARLINTLYVAGAITSVLYGASRWIISPMVENLSEARHDYLSHSQIKVDEMNERLSKLVSKIPESENKAQAVEQDTEDTESETSDPTELYHKDMGTQTSPLPSRKSSISDISTQPKTNHVTSQTSSLESLRGHLHDITEAAESALEVNKDRRDTVNKLRHYLDGLIYGTAGAMWHNDGEAVATKMDAVTKDDPIEELKKEIRGVKGILLSAKRFPAASRPITGAA